MNEQPFRIHVEQSTLDDLHTRLRRTRWSSALKSETKSKDWDFGTNADYLHELVNYWHTAYDWRQHEAKLNSFAQFKAQIDATAIHFIHVKGHGPRAMPLLLLHGWPDSFYRFYKVIPIFSDVAGVLADPMLGDDFTNDSFDVVVPSLPGFAFSDSTQRVTREQPNRYTAQLIWRLMTEVLGYRQFAIAGGDGGGVIAQIMAIDHPESVIGIHLTDLGWHATNIDPSSASKAEQKYLTASKKYFMKDSAYAMVQMTRPRSLAAGFNDSPVGLASWIVDRFHSWADGDIEKRFSKDELLTNIMLYWTTQTIGSSMFTYYADARSPSLTPADHVDIPVGLALFPKDGSGIPPRSLAERTLNVQRWVEMPQGGHFAALEEPELFAEDVIEFFRSLRAETQDFDRAIDSSADRQTKLPFDQEPHHVR